jgi:hypothetical protein
MHTSPIEVQKALKNMNYPANKGDIIKHAKGRDARSEVMQDLENLPEKQYTSAADVSKEFKGD